MNHTPQRPAGPVRLWRVTPEQKARCRLASIYRAQCALPEGGVGELLVHADEATCHRLDEGLPLSTRFGTVAALDYGPLLLACTGVDVAGTLSSSAHRALARYAFAALAPELQAALGDPMVCDAPTPHPETSLVVRLALRLPSVRLTMHLRMRAEGVHALLDSGPWERVAKPAQSAPWLSTIKAQVPLILGSAALPLVEYERLAPGDIVCPERIAFDVTGRGVVRIAARRLRIRWRDAHQCFEVEDMSDILASSPENTGDHAPSDASLTATAELPIRLSFSLGALSLTVGDIAALGCGSLLELEQGLPPTVRIEANGSPVGIGELVDLDGRLAVEITQWPRGASRSHSP